MSLIEFGSVLSYGKIFWGSQTSTLFLDSVFVSYKNGTEDCFLSILFKNMRHHLTSSFSIHHRILVGTVNMN